MRCLVPLVALLAGCATHPMQVAVDDGEWCEKGFLQDDKACDVRYGPTKIPRDRPSLHGSGPLVSDSERVDQLKAQCDADDDCRQRLR